MLINAAFDYYKQLVLSESTERARNTEISRWEIHLAPQIGGMALEDLNALRIRILQNELSKKGLAPQTVYHCLSLLRRVLNRAVEWELYPGPVPKIRMPKFNNQRVRYLTLNEADKLLNELNQTSPIWHDITLFALNTGLRRGEILSLTPSNIDRTCENCNILDSKTHTGRSIPLNQVAKKIVKTYLIKSPNPETPLFHEDRKPVNPHAKVFPKAVKTCGLNFGVKDRRSQVCFHSLRHTFASWLVQKGTPLQIVSQLLGHTTIKMTMRYAHLAPDQSRRAVESIAAA